MDTLIFFSSAPASHLPLFAALVLVASGTSPGTQPRLSWGHSLAQPRGNLVFPNDPQACRRGIEPKKIATFKAHTQALAPWQVLLWPATSLVPTYG